MDMKYLAIAAAIACSGCSAIEAPELAACEAFVTSKLRSPSTYERIESEVIPNIYTPAAWEARQAEDAAIGIGRRPFPVPGAAEIRYTLVSINYDAANAYGTPVRSHELCEFARPTAGEEPSRDELVDRAAFRGRLADGDDSCCLADEGGR